MPSGTIDIQGGKVVAVSSTATFLPSFAIAPAATPGAAESGTTVTITTATPNTFQVGQTVTIAGVPTAGYNGTFAITAVLSSTQFQYIVRETAAYLVYRVTGQSVTGAPGIG